MIYKYYRSISEPEVGVEIVINKLDEFKVELFRYIDELVAKIDDKEKQVAELDRNIRNGKSVNENLQLRISEFDR
jgi:hypothetical protein